jgi:aminocarboxymuconate-semialdehyde decarboxylase
MNGLLSNRRNFLMGAAATAGTVAVGFKGLSALAAPAPAARKQVMINGRRVRVVDIHAHCVIPAAQEVIRGTNVQGNFAGFQILGPQRLVEMDRRGIDVQVLSVNAYWWYAAADRNLAGRIVRTHDEGIAAWVKANPTRFVGLTSPALQHPDLAAEQLDYAVKTLGMRGASIGGNVRGEVPSTLFLSKLIFDGTFDRFPRLKVCGAHGGGYLPSYFGRTQVTCDVRDNANCANKKKPQDYLRTNIMADTMVFSDEGLRHLVAEMGTSQLVYGTDIPFNWPDTLDLVVNASFLTDAQKEAIIGGNLINLLKIGACGERSCARCFSPLLQSSRVRFRFKRLPNRLRSIASK